MSEGEKSRMKLRKRSKTRSSRALPVLQKVQPKIPTDERELEKLRDNLSGMGCAKLLDVAWGVQEESLIRDIVGPIANTWDNML